MAAGLGAALVTVVIAASAHAAGRIELSRTGQTTSYASGDDGDLEVGVAWPTPRFTANGDGTWTDELTGLVWLGDANCPNSVGHDPQGTGDGSMYWSSALAFVSSVNLATQDILACGYTGSPQTDWRLPNVVELESLVDVEVVDQSTWLAGQGFSQVQSGRYWSSTTHVQENILNAYNLDTSDGRIGASLKESSTYWVWLVRAGPDGSPDPSYPANLWRPGSGGGGHGVVWPAPRLVDNGDGTVTDRLTGLMWLKDVTCLGNATWSNAFATVANFNGGSHGCTDYTAGTYGDWRVPNRKEFFSLIDNDASRPALPPSEPFVNLAAFAAYQHSTTVAAISNEFWVVATWIFSGISQQGKGSLPVWPVRTVGPPQIPAVPAWGRAALVLGIGLLGATALAIGAARGRRRA